MVMKPYTGSLIILRFGNPALLTSKNLYKASKITPAQSLHRQTLLGTKYQNLQFIEYKRCNFGCSKNNFISEDFITNFLWLATISIAIHRKPSHIKITITTIWQTNEYSGQTTK